MTINKIQLAARFKKFLIDEIGPEKYAETIELNRQETDKNICHSHDFCDANMVMLEAVKSFGLDEDQAMEVMLHESIVNEAWNYWKTGKAE